MRMEELHVVGLTWAAPSDTTCILTTFSCNSLRGRSAEAFPGSECPRDGSRPPAPAGCGRTPGPWSPARSHVAHEQGPDLPPHHRVRPSTGSSSTRMSGLQAKRQPEATCFYLMPLLIRRWDAFIHGGGTPPAASLMRRVEGCVQPLCKTASYPGGGGKEVVKSSGMAADAAFDLRVFIHRLPSHQDGPPRRGR